MKLFVSALLLSLLSFPEFAAGQIIGPPLDPVIPPINFPIFFQASSRLGHGVIGPGDKLENFSALSGNRAAISGKSGGSVYPRVYLFEKLDSQSERVSPFMYLYSSDPEDDDGFGRAVALSSEGVLVGAPSHGPFTGGRRRTYGQAYFYRAADLSGASASESVILRSSVRKQEDNFGSSVALNGDLAVVATPLVDSIRGKAYVFRNLSSASGIVTEDAILVASDGAPGSRFGHTLKVSGNNALIGSYLANQPGGTMQGAAYFFRDIDSVSGTVTENVRLSASDRKSDDRLGIGVALSGDRALVVGDRAKAAYLYRNLQSASGTVYQNAKLVASRNVYAFGSAAAISGDHAIIRNTVMVSGVQQPVFYLYLNLSEVVGTPSNPTVESVRIYSSIPNSEHSFSSGVSLDGDRFLLADSSADDRGYVRAGIAYTGTVSALTKLDSGLTEGEVDGISFSSDIDWVIGESGRLNWVRLKAFNTAEVNAEGRAVYIGRNAGSDRNRLDLGGKLITESVYVGSSAGNSGNMLDLRNTADISEVGRIRLADGNSLFISGNVTNPADLFAYLGETALEVFSGGSWIPVNEGNASVWLDIGYSSEKTRITPAEVSGYSGWISGYFPVGDPRAEPLADADGDRFPAVFEYLFGTAPDDSGERPEIAVSAGAGGLKVEVRVFDRADLDWELQYSADLKSWQSLSPGSATVVESFGDGSTRLRFSADTGGERGFVRVRILEPLPD